MKKSREELKVIFEEMEMRHLGKVIHPNSDLITKLEKYIETHPKKSPGRTWENNKKFSRDLFDYFPDEFNE